VGTLCWVLSSSRWHNYPVIGLTCTSEHACATTHVYAREHRVEVTPPCLRWSTFCCCASYDETPAAWLPCPAVFRAERDASKYSLFLSRAELADRAAKLRKEIGDSQMTAFRWVGLLWRVASEYRRLGW
jgi:hypothetical protein